MPYNGAGQYNIPVAAPYPPVGGAIILVSQFTAIMDDIASALSSTLVKDGQQVPTADLPMGTRKHTAVGNAAARDQYAATGQVQDQGFTWCGTAGGTADAITLTPSPPLAAYTAGQAFVYKSGASPNANPMTVALSGMITKAIQKNGLALIAGDHAANSWFRITYDGAAFQLEAIDLVTVASLTAAISTAVTAAVPTGVMQDYVGSTAPTGFVLASGRTIGDATSGGTERANADTVNLFTLLWNSMANTEAAVSGGRGASAAADFAAHKTLALPDLRGRVTIGKDDMGGTAANRITNAVAGIVGTTLGASGGNQNLHQHIHGVTDLGHSHTVPCLGGPGGSGAAPSTVSATASVATTTDVAGISIQNAGTGASQNVQPSYVVNKIIKL